MNDSTNNSRIFDQEGREIDLREISVLNPIHEQDLNPRQAVYSRWLRKKIEEADRLTTAKANLVVSYIGYLQAKRKLSPENLERILADVDAKVEITHLDIQQMLREARLKNTEAAIQDQATIAEENRKEQLSSAKAAATKARGDELKALDNLTRVEGKDEYSADEELERMRKNKGFEHRKKMLEEEFENKSRIDKMRTKAKTINELDDFLKEVTDPFLDKAFDVAREKEVDVTATDYDPTVYMSEDDARDYLNWINIVKREKSEL